MRPIVNSLGSNYDFKFVALAIKQIFGNTSKSITILRKKLNQMYDGKSFLFYKGRDAIEFGLRAILEPGSLVLTQAFSCYAVEEGIVRAGMKPVYVDIGADSTNMTVDTLTTAIKQYPKAKAVIVQHSLGLPADIINIRRWCEKNDVLLVEDLAQSVGGKDKNDQYLGTLADVIILSFGRDKIVDTVAGGAVIFKNLDKSKEEQIIKLKDEKVSQPSQLLFIIDMLYPLLTWVILQTHYLLLGRLLFRILKYLKVIDSPSKSNVDHMSQMHPGYADLVLKQFDSLTKQINHRQNIAKIYFQKLDPNKYLIVNNEEDLELGCNLRFVIRHKKIKRIILELKKSGVYLSDRWYRKPVDCSGEYCTTVYQTGSCKNAEKLTKEVINLPTHIHIGKKQAEKIIKLLNNMEFSREL
jgi:perosamine synthetase